jgi:aminoglycoside phosphotransferase (APT) family kinase protein
LILRIYPGQGALTKAQREYRGMQILYSAGFPVPQLIALEAALFDQPCVIMERIPGRTLLQVMEIAPDAERAEHMTRFCELFARLHQADWRPLAVQPERYDDANAANQMLIERYRGNVTTTGMTCMLPVLDWAAAQTSALVCTQPSIVHQDFHPDNVLWTGHDLIVIDWTAIAVYDRRIDLAWTLLLAGSFMGAAVRAQILRLYENAARTMIHDIEIFEALASVRRFNDLWQTVRKGGASWGLRPEALVAMRTQAPYYQQQYARLQTITGLRITDLEELIAALTQD